MFSTINKQLYKSKQIKISINNALHNLNILINNNKSDHTVLSLQQKVFNMQKDNNCSHNIYDINKKIHKIYISYCIQEALIVLSKNRLYSNTVINYELEYNHYYYNDSINDLLNLLLKLENNIKRLHPYRNTFNLLPFYYNIYLYQMK